MLQTTEMRWFFHGSFSDDVLAWFCEGQTIPIMRRTDRYLVFPACESVGVKIREGLFEIKAIRGSEVIRSVADCVGKLGSWVKWSADNFPLEALTFEESSWVDVEKARRLRRFEVGEEVIEVALEEPLERGCEIELTEIVMLGEQWWTFALEAFGDVLCNRDNLYMVAESIFSVSPGVSFDVKSSFAYPGWLSDCLLSYS